jgi:defect-in-organelle-trafficking protein DotA
MKRFWLTLLLIGIAGIGFATPDPSDLVNLPGNGLVPLGTVPGSDMSVKYLGQLFGSVGGAITNTGGVQLLQELFGIFNKAILALAVAWTSYTVVTTLFNSAMEGGFITSQRKQAVFIFVRLALGFALLLPLTSGYSTLQVLGMRAIMEGVNLANQVWDQTIVFITRKGIMHNYSDKDSTTTSAMIGANGWNASAYIYSPQNMKGITGTQAILYDMQCTAYYAASAPSSLASQGPVLSPLSLTHQQSMNFPSIDSPTGCGTYQLTNSDNAQDTQQSQIEISMVYGLWPIAQNLISIQGISPTGSSPVSDGSGVIADAAQSIANTLSNYVSSTQLNIQNNQVLTPADFTKDQTWEVQAADQGWFGAGRFYWLLSKSNWDNVTAQSTSSSGTPVTISWPSLSASATPSTQSVALPSDSDWNNSKPTSSTEIKSVYSVFLIPATQSAVDAANYAFSSNPTGAAAFNKAGLCANPNNLNNLPSGVTYGHNALLNGFNWIPNGSGTSPDYLLLSNATSASGLPSNTFSACSGSYTIPVLVNFNNATYGTHTECYSGGEGVSDCVQVPNTASYMAQQAGYNYPGVRLCPLDGLSQIDPSQFTTETDYCDAAVAQYSSTNSISTSAISNPSFKSVTLNGMPIVPDVMSDIASKFAELAMPGSRGLSDPLYFMNQLGQALLSSAGNVWEQGSTQIQMMAAWEGVWSQVLPGASIFQAFISWWEPVFIMVGGGFFVAGFMLCFYAPLYPFVLFLLGALNWLMVCVEFMIALPLVALGVTHPEGHDFLGKAEIALMLILSACLRPVLMIFGFIGGMVMSFIGFSAVNYMFSNVLVTVFGDFSKYGAKTPSVMTSIFGVVTGDFSGKTDQSMSGDHFTGHQTTDMLLIPLLMVFYGYLVVEVVHFCFTLIHQLPDQVLRWIGGPVGQDRTQGVADKIQSGVSSSAKQMSDTQGKSAMAAGKASGAEVGGIIGGSLQLGMDAAKMAA